MPRRCSTATRSVEGSGQHSAVSKEVRLGHSLVMVVFKGWGSSGSGCLPVALSAPEEVVPVEGALSGQCGPDRTGPRTVPPWQDNKGKSR